MRKNTVVFGSFVVDLMSRTPHLPQPGETVKGLDFTMGPGGKGFNQCVAAHKAGADVLMMTKLGKDSFSRVCLDTMEELGMNKKHIIRTSDFTTGTAIIMVDEKTGENQIVVVPSACTEITDEEVEGLKESLVNCDYVLTQLETNLSAVEKLVEIAKQTNTKVILNTAPIQKIDESMLKDIYMVTPNEVEAEILTGVKIKDLESANKASKWFSDKGVEKVIITLGKRGVYVFDGVKSEIIPAYKVDVIDTTGAGDAFNGGLLAALTEGKDIWEACKFGNAVGALCVQKIGTTPAMPTRAEIDEFMKNKN
ncbi:ribokinase [Lagierella sp.]|uniref:ribokinase n=1 Tax=Lagierella sp. TaxID=2849657 RepID=UPI0026052918|nr:ribokinase [Lagierella sp.]